MKSSGFGTSGIVLMAMSVVCFGLAIGFVLPVFTQNAELTSNDLRANAVDSIPAADGFSEFYPAGPTTRNRVPEEVPTYVGRHSAPPRTSIQDRPSQVGLGSSVADPFRIGSVPAESRVVSSLSPVPTESASPEQHAEVVAGRLLTPSEIPGGSVYAPVTVNVDNDRFSEQLSSLAERIERAVAQGRAEKPADGGNRERRLAKRQIDELSQGVIRLEQAMERLQFNTQMQFQKFAFLEQARAAAAVPPGVMAGRVARRDTGAFRDYPTDQNVDVGAEYYVGDPGQLPDGFVDDEAAAPAAIQQPMVEEKAQPAEPAKSEPEPEPAKSVEPEPFVAPVAPEAEAAEVPEIQDFPAAPELQSLSIPEEPAIPFSDALAEVPVPAPAVEQDAAEDDSLDDIRFPEIPHEIAEAQPFPTLSLPDSSGSDLAALEIPGLKAVPEEASSTPLTIPAQEFVPKLPEVAPKPDTEQDLVAFFPTQTATARTQIKVAPRLQPEAEVANGEVDTRADLRPVPDSWFTPAPVAYNSTYRFRLDVTDNGNQKVMPASGNVCQNCGRVHDAAGCHAPAYAPSISTGPVHAPASVPPPAEIPRPANEPDPADFTFLPRPIPADRKAIQQVSARTERSKSRKVFGRSRQHQNSRREAKAPQLPVSPSKVPLPKTPGNTSAQGPQSGIKTVAMQKAAAPLPQFRRPAPSPRTRQPEPKPPAAKPNYGTVEYELPVMRKPTRLQPESNPASGPPKPQKQGGFLGRLKNTLQGFGR